MIVERRDHRERMEMSIPLKSLIDEITNIDIRELSAKLNANLNWDRPRGDLLHWIPVLNRFDEIFEEKIKKYGLDQEYPILQVFSNEDQTIVIACLQFTWMLLEHCADMQLYASSDRIFDFLNTPTVDVRLKALEVGVLIGEKYVQTFSHNYVASSAVKDKVLQLAKSYPPPVPANYNQKKPGNQTEKKDEKPSVIGDHYNFIDTITIKKKYPSKWKQMNFQYYKAASTPQQSAASNKGDKKSKSKASKSSKKKESKLIPTEGIASFSLSEETVRKLTLEQIYDKASEVIPKSSWYEFGMSAAVTKSFNNKSYESIKLREKLLQIKCLAIGMSSCICSSQVTSAKLFEVEPYIFGFLVDLIHPENHEKVSKEVYFSAVKALECISLRHDWGSDIVRCLSGNVSHGILFQCLRLINKQIRNEDEDYYEKANIHFFNMLGNLISTKSLAQRLSSGGFINDLILFLDVKTKYRWTCSAAAHLTSLYLASSMELIEEFVEKDGFNLLINTVKYEVDFALENPNYLGGACKDSIVHYSITFRQANYIRSLMKLVSYLLDSDLGDRLRNLFDSPILDSFNKILTNPNVFGPLILSSTIDSVFYIIHNEPTAFSILNEAKVIDTMLDNYESLFLPSSSLLRSLPEVIGAICLNKEGLKKVIDKGTIPSYFKTFYNLEFAKELVRSDMSVDLGCSFDELARHYPALKPIILEEASKLVRNINPFIQGKLGGLRYYTSPKGALYSSKNDEILEKEEGQLEIESWDNSDAAYIIDNVFVFLGDLFQESGQWATGAIELIKFEYWLGYILSSTSAPYDYLNSSGMSTLMGILKYFDDENRNYGLPIIVESMKEHLDSTLIQEFINYQSTDVSFFNRFEANEVSGTNFLRSLSSVHSLLFTLTDIYINPRLMFHDRIQQVIELFGGYGLQSISDLGLLLERCVIEEVLLRSNMPDDIVEATLPVREIVTAEPPVFVHAKDPTSKKLAGHTSAKFKNSLQLRYYLSHLQNYISKVLSSIGKVCMHKKQDHVKAEWRRDAVEITLGVGKVFASAFDREFSNPYYKASYTLAMANMCNYTLSEKGRAREVVHTSLAIAFLQTGVYGSLKRVAINLWNSLLDQDPNVVSETKDLKYISTAESSILKNALSQILLVFVCSVFGDNFSPIPQASLYFHQGYGKDIDSKLVSALLNQTRLVTFELLKEIVGSESRLYNKIDRMHAENIPTPLIEQAMYLTTQVYTGSGDQTEAELIPLTLGNIFPPGDQVAYLISLGMDEVQAEHFFKHYSEVRDIVDKLWPECPQAKISQEEWELFREAIGSDVPDFSIEFQPFPKYQQLVSLKANNIDALADEWINTVRFYPKTLESTSKMLFLVLSDPQKIMDKLFHFMSTLSETGCKGEDLATSLSLLGMVLKRVHIAKVDTERIRQFTNFISNEIESCLHDLNENYFAAMLEILDIFLVYKELPVPEKTKYEKISYNNPVPFIIDDETRAKIFEVLIKIGDVVNIKSALAVTRIMVVFSKEYSYATRIGRSDLLKSLVKLPQSLDPANQENDEFKTCLVILARRCFEDPEVLKNIFSVEVGSFLNEKVKLDLQSCLKLKYPLILRNPNMFIDVLSKNIYLENFDGSPESLANGKLIIRKIKKDDHEDVQMDDAEDIKAKTQLSFDSTGIIHTLLSQLMVAIRADWISDPPKTQTEKEKESKTKDSKSKKEKNSELFKNKEFSYVCFLIQTITELLASYKQSKLEFLTFSKKSTTDDKLKPRSTALNFFIHQLIPTHPFESSGSEFERRSAVSSLAKLALVGLVSSPILDEENEPSYKKEDFDMAFIRRYFVEILQKILTETVQAPLISVVRYGKLLDLFDLSGVIISAKFRDTSGPLLNKRATKYDQYFISKVLIDKQIPVQITSILADLDLNFPNMEKVIKAALKPLSLLGKAKTEFQEIFEEEHQGEKEDDDIVPDDVDDREETPDLFRNSTLGMYDAEFESDEDLMEYYDEEGPLEVLMSGEDISESEDGSSGLSELESGDDAESILIDDGYDESGMEDDVSRDENDDLDSEASMNDIEIIDELNIGSQSESDEGIDEGDNSEQSDFYDFSEEEEDDGNESEYDDEELDGWIAAFEDDDLQSGNEEDDGIDPDDVSLQQARREPNRRGYDEDEYDELHSYLDYSLEDGASSDGGPNRFQNLLGGSQMQERAPALANLLETFLGDGRPLLRGSIEINGTNHQLNSHNDSLGRTIESLLNINHRGKPSEDPNNYMYVKSTRERWSDSMKIVYSQGELRDLHLKIIPAVVNRIEAQSIDYYNKKKAETDRIQKEKEERLRKKEEEEVKKKEEEAKERDENPSPNTSVTLDPIMVRIGDREVDISGTEIDPEFFEALPDDMREEVFTQHVRERRANATSTGTDAREIDPDFLDALPDNIRDEILQQESMARRLSSIENLRFGDEEYDEDTGDEGGEGAEENPFQDAEGGNISSESPKGPSRKSKKVFFTPLIDRQGVSSLVRLLFAPISMSQREHIFHTLQYISKSKQTRMEVMGLMIAILHDGLTNHRSFDKIYSQICGRVSGHKENKLQFKLPLGSTPISIGVQLIECVNYLLERNSHLRYYLVTEHENPFLSKKLDRKATLKEFNKENKFAINFLMKMLENDLIKEDQTFMDILARILQISTRPLHTILKGGDESAMTLLFTPPLIPDDNYRQMIKILTANDCSNTTFRRTISAMQNLSVLPNAQKVFSLELSDQATFLGKSIIQDLQSLLKELSHATVYSTENKFFSKFSAPSSDQAKLLRILTALDYMYESKEKERVKLESEETKEQTSETHSVKENVAAKDIEALTEIYKTLALGNLWEALSDCLRLLETRPDLDNVVTALLPLIEALMVVCKRSKVRELQIKDVLKYEAKKIDFTKEPIERLFFSFTDEHKKILNQMVRTNPNLMSGPFGMLVRNPRVLEFDNKKNYFDRKLHQDKNENNKLSINIRRDQVFLDSYRALFFKSKDEFKNSKLEINFKGEAGVDAGGVTREWYQVLSRQMFNPDYALFTPVASDETTFHPNRTSYINPEHLSFFKFIGRVIGKAIYDYCFLDCHFSRAVYKRILGIAVSLKDMETLDLEYFKSLMWMLENDITDVITEDFSMETDDYGEHKTIDLIPNGRNIPVDETNKHEYVKLVVNYRLQTSVAEQMDNFLIGFHEIIPKELVAIFDEQELELLISGLPDISVNDWQNNSTYSNYSASSLQIQWFWRAVKSFDNEERAKLLQFATGTSKVPLNGFKGLSGANGTCKFSIHRDYGALDRLPSSHTCFNQIDLPAYETYETLRGSLLLAITEGHEGFGLA